MMGNGIIIQIWLPILDRKKTLWDILICRTQMVEVYQLQGNQEMMILLLMVINQNQMWYMLEKTLHLKDQKPEANMAKQLVHTSRIQAKLAAVMIKRAL